MKTRWAIGLLVVLVAAAFWHVAPVVRLGSAWYAKTLCSGVFVAGRDADRVIAQDVLAEKSASLKAFQATIDRAAGRVDASLHGLFRSTAIFRPGLGCTLLNGTTTEALKAQARGRSTDRPVPSSGQLWPLGDKVSGSDGAVDRFLEAAFSEPDPNSPKRTRAVVIVHHGKIVAERYAAGFDAETPLSGWSMAKSAINALIGILVGEGRLAPEGRGLRREWAGSDDLRARITVEHLLRMTDGLAFDDPNQGRINDVRRMVYLSGNTARYAAAKPATGRPGSAWAYSSAATSILCGLVETALSGRDGHPMDFPKVALFDRIGMRSAVFERDAAGTLVGAAFLHASARDWARLGLLYLQDGIWEGERILPESWVGDSTRPTNGSNGSYGAHIWLRIPEFMRPADAARHDLPGDAFFLLGRDGQMVAVVPSRALVAVRLGLTRDRSAWDPEAFLAELLAVLSDDRSSVRCPG